MYRLTQGSDGKRPAVSVSARLEPALPLTPTEAAALLEACGGGARGARNRAALTLQYRAGLRCAESLSVRLCDLEMHESGAIVVRVQFPKGIGRWAAPRRVGIGARWSAPICAWLELRGEGAPTDPLFITPTGRPICTSYFRRLVPRLAERAGIYRRVHPHALRHTFACECYEEGMGVMEIMRLLGHSSLQTTQRYLEGLSAKRAVEASLER